RRILELPTEVDSEKANAEFRNGVLTLTLPIRESVKPR
ncbi:Hsp20/alpha crystallin family protein, partial [Leptospira interrogans]|nr:Hsp20/alpha crystallin family protein [Leptospira interrogans]